MIQFPNAKLNIGLSVTEKRADGYHTINSVFYPVPFFDALELLPSQVDAFVNTGLTIPGVWEDNLIYKALLSVRLDYDAARAPFCIHLHKHIPMGAGLGGGSADAGFFLKMINEFFSLQMQEEELYKRALDLGSDVPFFIQNKTTYAEGRGDLLQHITLDLSAYSIQIVCPKVHISTAKAFEGITPKPAIFDLKNLPTLPIANWKDLVVNDFEQVVYDLYPSLKYIKTQLYEGGAIYASLSGSGSAIYGIFKKGHKAKVLTERPAQTYYLP